MRRSSFVPVVAVLVLVVTGCSSGGGSTDTGHHRGSKIQLPAVPHADVPDSKLLPAMAPVPHGDARAQAAALAKQVAAGGKGAVSALRRALVLSGIDLQDVGGAVVDHGVAPKQGVAIPLGQLAEEADDDTLAHGMSIADLSTVLAGIANRAHPAKPVDPRLLALRMFSELGSQEQDGNLDLHYAATTRFLSSFIELVGEDAPTRVSLTGNDVPLTGLQTWLLTIGLAGGAAQAAKVLHDGGKLAAPAAFVRPAAVRAGSGGCRTSDTEGQILDLTSIGTGQAATGTPFTSWGGLMQEIIPDGSKAIPWVNILLAMVHILAESSTFQAELSMVGGEPLVRTKDGHPGAQKRVQVHAHFDIGDGQYANCLRTALNLAGIDGSVPNDGDIAGANVEWHLGDEASGVADNPVIWRLDEDEHGAGKIESTTDKDGTASKTLEGQPQKTDLPPDPKPYIRLVDVSAHLQAKGTSITGDLTDAIGALSAGPAIPAAILGALLDRMHMFGVHRAFRVQDWQRDFKVDAITDLDAGKYNSVGEYPRVTGTKCDGLGGEWHLSVGGKPFSFTLNDNGHGSKPSNGLGIVRISYEPGTPAKIQFKNKYLEQSFTVIPGDFCKD